MSTLTCNHKFHADCVAKWLAMRSARGRCPVCRSRATVVSTCPVALELTDNPLSIGFAALIQELGGSPGNRPSLHALLKQYAAHPFVRALIASVPVQSTRGLRPLCKVFDDCYQPYGDHWLPYIRNPGMSINNNACILDEYEVKPLHSYSSLVFALVLAVYQIFDRTQLTVPANHHVHACC
jgi:hypothetical protein